MDEGWINFHLLLWRYTIFHLVQVEIEEAPFMAHEVWQAAWARFERKALSKLEGIKTTLLLADSRGTEPPNLAPRGVCLHPLLVADESGIAEWNDVLVAQIKSLTTAPKKTGKSKKGKPAAPPRA